MNANGRKYYCCGVSVLCLPVLGLLMLTGCRPDAAPALKINAPGAVPPDRAAQSEAKTDAAMDAEHAIPDAYSKSIVTVAKPPQRIVSLAPSNTEILFALGLDKRIAGDTTQCDFPPEAAKKPHVGGYPISSERVLALNPDMIVAVAGLNNAVPFEHKHVTVVVAQTQTLNEVYETIHTLGVATWTTPTADQIVSRMKTQIAAISQVAAAQPNHPCVLVLHQAAPLYTTPPDSFIAAAIAGAGGEYEVKGNLPRNIISAEQVMIDKPDVILCDAALVPQIKALPGWAQSVPAVRNNRFYTGESAALLMRPGPRLPQAIEDLARYLHPDAFAGKPRIAAP